MLWRARSESDPKAVGLLTCYSEACPLGYEGGRTEEGEEGETERDGPQQEKVIVTTQQQLIA